MKIPKSSVVKRQIAKGTPVYTAATIYVPKIGSSDYKKLELDPENFKLNNNSYEHTSGNMFPIGMVLSKSITISIDNTNGVYASYDWHKAEIVLSSRIYYLNQTHDLDEGTFYVSDINLLAHTIELTAFDLLSFLDFPLGIRTYGVSSQYINTVWEYVEYLCNNTISNRILGAESTRFYDDSTINKLLNIDKTLDIIVPNTNPNTTCRDVLGYLAQIMGANVVMSNSQSINRSENRAPVYLIKFVPVDLTIGALTVINAGRIEENVEDIIDCGEIHSASILLTYISDDLTVDAYPVLTDFSNINVEYDDFYYTNIELTYPVRNDNKTYTVSSERGTDENVLKLYNPIMQRDKVENNSELKTALNDLYIRVCGTNLTPNTLYKIRKFKGSFANNPLIEFTDPVFVIDENCVAYTSVVTSHLYKYLDGSELQCSMPSEMQNCRYFFR